MAQWESSNASHNLPASELLNSQHSLEISSVCQGLLVELDCSHKSFKFHLVKSGDRQEITRKHNVVQGAYKHSLIKRSKTRRSQPHACADVFQLCRRDPFLQVVNSAHACSTTWHVFKQLSKLWSSRHGLQTTQYMSLPRRRSWSRHTLIKWDCWTIMYASQSVSYTQGISRTLTK